MNFKTGLFFVALAIGCTALPTQPEDDMSIFFEHVDVNARIVGGTEAPVGSHPHMAALTNGLIIRSFTCGGSLISSTRVLTAAHCISAFYSFGSLSNNLRVTVGTNRWNSGGQTYSVSRNITHSNYVSNTIKNDIGILVVSSAVQMNADVRPIVLNYEFIGANVPTIVAGWGRIRQGGSLSAILLELNASTYDGDRCVEDVARWAQQNDIRAPPVEPHIEICTFHSNARGTCNGDSGSALSRADNKQQIGIVSWGIPCARGAPDMFVRVSAFESWLQLNI